MTARNNDSQVSIGIMDTTITFEPGTTATPPQAGAGDQGDEARHGPHDQPDGVERNADRLGRRMVVGNRAQRATDARLLEEDAEHDHQRDGDDRRDQFAAVDQQAAVEDLLEQEDRVFRQADVDLVDVVAEH